MPHTWTLDALEARLPEDAYEHILTFLETRVLARTVLAEWDTAIAESQKRYESLHDPIGWLLRNGRHWYITELLGPRESFTSAGGDVIDPAIRENADLITVFWAEQASRRALYDEWFGVVHTFFD